MVNNYEEDYTISTSKQHTQHHITHVYNYDKIKRI